ncbi:extracellular metalloproteinase 3 [Ophiostoma piceae UAMH 11346]|uniref:Extracellular metalloproteinase 3 n=1 Tax=Ophiostoma piceae (strain UAMH 11346) TaxID=1262450 RepID=S3CQP6_OPHP1|nr:extracellular metalloproteinase 3 [Ophiostoma piceae UAMH 11346]
MKPFTARRGPIELVPVQHTIHYTSTIRPASIFHDTRSAQPTNTHSTNTAKMPLTDCLEPPLTPEERKIVKAYGGWTYFMHSMGLKPTSSEDEAEGKAILEAFVAGDEDGDEE